ncbi:MAG: hypothetical protein EHM71_18675, partial [Zetaproteobacteria bacterium]
MAPSTGPAPRVQASGVRIPLLVSAVSVLCAVALAGAAAAQTPPTPEPDAAEALFDPSVVHDLRLTMKPEDWDTL